MSGWGPLTREAYALRRDLWRFYHRPGDEERKMRAWLRAARRFERRLGKGV